jgi:tetratricopeptide (TPR) repeat protein
LDIKGIFMYNTYYEDSVPNLLNFDKSKTPAYDSEKPFTGVDYRLSQYHNRVNGFVPGIWFSYRLRMFFSANIIRLSILSLVLILTSGLYLYYSKHYGNLTAITSAYSAYSIGNAYSSKGKIKESIKYYKKAIKINPKFAPAYYQLAIAYDTLGDMLESERYFNQFKKLKPNQKELEKLKAILSK